MESSGILKMIWKDFKDGFLFPFKKRFVFPAILCIVLAVAANILLLPPSNKTLIFNEQEKLIYGQLIKPSDINVTFKDIAGLDDIISSIESDIILPLLVYPYLNDTSLFQPPKGVLLYGPPGCGKTLLAKAIAVEANARFINLELSSITDKSYGEPQKRVKALFTLAEKIKPCIIFIDEVDSLFRFRGSFDHEATSMMKSQFMSLWDGLTTRENSGVVILGATNRPCDIDDAILRRMPSRYEIALPDFKQRKAILGLLSKNILIGNDVDFYELAHETGNFSGSDLKELCRQASLAPYLKQKENILRYGRNGGNISRLDKILATPREVTGSDFRLALDKVKTQMAKKKSRESCPYN